MTPRQLVAYYTLGKQRRRREQAELLKLMWAANNGPKAVKAEIDRLIEED